MPEAMVVRSGTGHYQVITQRLPHHENYFYDKSTQGGDGDPTKSPCIVATRPDGSMLRSYDVAEMRRWAKKLNEEAKSDRKDGMMSAQKSRCAAHTCLSLARSPPP